MKAGDNGKFIHRRKARSNEILFCYPDEEDIGRQLTWDINRNKAEWEIKDVETGEVAVTQGLGLVVSHIYEYESKIVRK